MSYLCMISLLLGLVGQPARTDGDAAADAKARLEFMKKSLAIYDVHAMDEGRTKFLLGAEPVLRFTNPVGGSKDGAVFLWLGAGGRPAAAVQIYWNPSQVWLEEFSSLCSEPLVVESTEDPRTWRPSKAGVSFKPVPDGPKPADTAERRLRQMRSMAEGFSAEHLYKGRTHNALRLLTKPLARYGAPGRAGEDGAIFCFVHGTDPEALLLLESRPGGADLQWQYAFAPLTSFAVSASWKGKEVWSQPAQANGSARDPTNTFHVRRVWAGGEN